MSDRLKVLKRLEVVEREFSKILDKYSDLMTGEAITTQEFYDTGKDADQYGGIAYDSSLGYYFFYSYTDGVLYMVDNTMTVVASVSYTIGGPFHLTCDQNGELWMCSYAPPTVHKFTYDSTSLIDDKGDWMLDCFEENGVGIAYEYGTKYFWILTGRGVLARIDSDALYSKATGTISDCSAFLDKKQDLSGIISGDLTGFSNDLIYDEEDNTGYIYIMTGEFGGNSVYLNKFDLSFTFQKLFAPKKVKLSSVGIEQIGSADSLNATHQFVFSCQYSNVGGSLKDIPIEEGYLKTGAQPYNAQMLNRLIDIAKANTGTATQGLMRSLGDAGSSPTNVTGKTTLKLLNEISSGRGPSFDRAHFVGTGGTTWNNASISAGDATDPVTMKQYARKTVYFLSDTAGKLTIQVVDPDGARRTYDTVSVSAGELESYIITAVAKKVALKFDSAATVTAWYEIQGP